jgi:hypothetical protein
MAVKRGAIWILAAVAATEFAGDGAVRAAAVIPDFSPSPKVGWVAYGPEFIPIPNQPHPVASDPAHPWVPNAVEYFFGRPKNQGNQTTSPMADLSNPILRPPTRAALAKLRADILAGKTIDNRTASCWPMGVPGSLVQPVRANYFLQGPHDVLITSQGTQDVRHIHLNVAHAANLKPSWFGDSIGHYEGDTLVVDTIGITTKAFVDNFRTPHSLKLHVVERYHLIDGGRTLQVRVHVEDPDAFTTPWNALQRFARVERGPLAEQTCAENNVNYFDQDVEPMPEADKPDF